MDEFNLLIAEPEANRRDELVEAVSSLQCGVEYAEDGGEVLLKVDQGVSVVLLNYDLPKISGLSCLKHLRHEYPEIPVIILSNRGVKAAVNAMQEEAFWYLEYPVEQAQIIEIVNGALEQYKNEYQRIQSKGLFSSSFNFIANAPKTKVLWEQVQRLAPLEATMLISGETGVGKTHLARNIHRLSSRADGPFISISCAALPRDLLEAELFGHEKGAFTGAVAARPGRLELADGGTLFLDEVGDLPLDLQPKLLTFLEDKKVVRIGAKVEKKLDVRIITATLKDLDQMCEAKTFREDLYYRLKVLSLELPPLRERLEDLPDLIHGILGQIAKREGFENLSLDGEALVALMQYEWPGNIRELINVLERAAIFSINSKITKRDLLFELQLEAARGEQDSYFVPGQQTLAEMEREMIKKTLSHCGGDKAEAARLLGITERTIYNKLKRYRSS